MMRTNQSFDRARAAWLMLVMGAALVVAPAALAQPKHLNQQTLIQELADRDMPELLNHLANTREFKDPVAKLQLQISTNELRYKNQQLPKKTREQAFQQALQQTEKLIQQYTDRPLRPLWKADYAEKVLRGLLQNRQRDAAAFYEFGVPQQNQRQAYHQRIAEVYRMLAEADQQLFRQRRLQAQKSDDDGPDQEREGGGEDSLNAVMRYELFEVLYKRRLPYYLGYTAYYTALLPNDHPYFQNLGQPDNSVPGQRSEPPSERNRLIQQAISELRPLANGEVSIAGGARRGAMSVAGRAMSEAGRQANAIDMLDRAIDRDGLARDGLLSKLGKARAVHRQGNFGRAYQLAEQAEQDNFATSNLLYRMLAVDAHHRLLMREADQKQGAERRKTLSRAFNPYQQMLNDLPSKQASSIRNFIFRRILSQVPQNADLSKLAPWKRLALAEMSRREGQNLVVTGQQENNQQKLNQAKQPLQRAIKAGETFTENEPGLTDDIRATGLYNLGLAQYFMAQIVKKNNRARILEAGQRLIQVAELAKNQPIAKQALSYGIQILQQIHQMKQVREAEKQAFVDAAELLFEQFPLSEVAESTRLYYGSAVLEPAGKYLEAAKNYNQVERDHPSYFDNQRRRLMALVKHLDTLDPDSEQASEARQRLQQAAQEVTSAAQSAAQGSGQQATKATAALGAATIAEATAAAGNGNLEQALDLLSDYKSQYDDAAGLLSEAQRRRLLLTVEAGRLDVAGDVARSMLERNPDNAAAVIDQALDQVQQEINRKTVKAQSQDIGPGQAQQLRQEAQKQAEVAAQLAQLLVQWARNQNYSGEKLLPFQLNLVKALRMAGNVAEAKAIIKPMVNGKYSNNANVINAWAEVLFAEAKAQDNDKESLIKAAEQFDKLIQGRQQNRGDLFWNAWSRRLQINDALGAHTEVIPRRVKQLKQNFDKNLGGEPYRSRLEQLADKYRAAA